MGSRDMDLKDAGFEYPYMFILNYLLGYFLLHFKRVGVMSNRVIGQ